MKACGGAAFSRQLGVERIFHSRNVQTALAVGHARGVVLLAAAEHDIEVEG